MNNSNSTSPWILKDGLKEIPCTSFPYAYRSMFNIVRKAIADKKPVNTKVFTILGPNNPRGERATYSYESATQLATEMGLLTPDGNINSKEFKRR